MAIITTAQFKEYIGLTGSTYDTLIGALISRAQKAMESECSRAFDSTSYTEYCDGTGTTLLHLDQWPVTAVGSVGVGITDPIQVTNTSSDAYNATVSNDGTTLTLAIEGGTNDGSDTLTLTSYTFTSLVAAIVALGKSWSATLMVSAMGVWDAERLFECYGLGCLDQYAYLQTPNELAADFTVYPNYGTIYYAAGFPAGYRNVLVRYTAGYSTTTMPADLQQICLELVKVYYSGRTASAVNVKSERLGDHSITYESSSAGEMPDGLKQRLMPYKRICV